MSDPPTVVAGIGRSRAAVEPRLVALGLCALAANAGIGLAVGGGKTSLGVLVAAAPLAIGAAAWLGLTHRGALAALAFALPLSGIPFDTRLPGAGGTAIYLTDVIVVLGFGGWVVASLASVEGGRRRLPSTPVLAWPFLFLAFAVLVGLARGHANWGTSYLSQPSRFLIYAGTVGIVAALTPEAAYRALVAVFYAGTFVQTVLAVFYLATGTSQTTSADLSTGGTRALALSTAMYLAGALVLALLNTELDRHHRRLGLHLGVAALATTDIILSLGRTTFVAVGVLVPILFLALRHARRTLLYFLPLALPVVALLAVGALQLYPSLGSTLANRLTGHVGNDTAVIERQREFDATLHGIDRHLAFGFGFGRPVRWVSVDRSIKTSTGGAENSYVWLLAGTGVVGLVALLVLIAAFFFDGLRRLRGASGERRALIIFALSMTFILLVNSLTGPVFTNAEFLLTLWVALLLPATVAKSSPAPSPRGS